MPYSGSTYSNCVPQNRQTAAPFFMSSLHCGHSKRSSGFSGSPLPLSRAAAITPIGPKSRPSKHPVPALLSRLNIAAPIMLQASQPKTISYPRLLCQNSTAVTRASSSDSARTIVENPLKSRSMIPIESASLSAAAPWSWIRLISPAPLSLFSTLFAT